MKNNEHMLALLLSHPTFDSISKEQLFHMIKKEIDWAEVYITTIQTKTSYLVYKNMQNFNLLFLLPASIKNEWLNSYSGNYTRNKALLLEYTKLQSLFEENCILLRPAKGIILLNDIYKDIGIRYLSDIDYIALPEQRKKIQRVLGEAGYHTLYVEDHTNDCSILYGKAPQNEYDIYYKIDISFTSINIDSTNEAIANLISMCLDFYKLAEQQQTISDLWQINLIKLIDIILYYEKYKSERFNAELDTVIDKLKLQQQFRVLKEYSKRFLSMEVPK